VIVVERQVSISVSSTMAHIGYFILFWCVLDLLVELDLYCSTEMS